MAEEELVKFPLRSANVALTGTTHATLLAAPPEGEAYLIRNIYGVNNSGGARSLNLHINKASTVTPIWASGSAANSAMFTPVTGGGQPHDFSIVLADTDESLEIDLSGTGTDVVYAFYEVVESKNFKSTSVALTGTSHVTLLAAPPEGVAYRVFRGYGVNTTGGNATVALHLNTATVATQIWFAIGAANLTSLFTQHTQTPAAFEIYLSDTDESLEADLAAAGTDRIFCFYEVRES